MRTLLHRGKIPEPESIVDARDRHRRLLEEVDSIQVQLADENRRLGRARGALQDYASWRRSAARALANFQEEARQLALWLEREEQNLLRRAYELLKDLELEFEFEPDEQDLMRKLDERFEIKRNKTKTA